MSKIIGIDLGTTNSCAMLIQLFSFHINMCPSTQLEWEGFR